MRNIVILSFVLILGGCSKPKEVSNVPLPPRLQSYFENYCDYDGSLGIGFVASHTYDFRFRQNLKETKDPELKRLFVLEHLHRDVEFELRDFERGIVRTGKTTSKPLTLSEWQDTQKKIQRQIDDLAAYSAFTKFATKSVNPLDRVDPSVDAMWMEELQRKLRSITYSPNQEVESDKEK